MVQKVIFDTDPGIDDALALLYLHACPALELTAITTTLGNASIENCTANALFLCEQFGIAAPVYRGVEDSIDGSVPDTYPDFVHGSNGLGGIPIAITHRELEAADATACLLHQTKKNPGEVRIIAVGRLTNIALALQQDKAFASRVQDIVCMGGSIEHKGNVSPFAEANMFGDPEAADLVFSSGIPLTMVGLDVTMQTTFSLAFLTSICADFPSALRNLVLTTNQVYGEYHKTSMGWDASPVHDSSAVAFADQPALFQTVRGSLSCVLKGEQRGRTVLTSDSAGPHQVCTAVDSETLQSRFGEVVKPFYRQPDGSP